jgi:ATP-dependent Lon protease
VPGPDLEARIDQLVAMFPNFERVTKTIVGVHARLLARGIEHRMPPLLLLGPPGVGKTVYAEAAGELLSAPVLRIDFASENSPSGLAGSSTFWANSSPGRLFNILAFGEDRDPVANPVIFVDELDKAAKNSQYDITGPLLRLLEKVSSQKFVDQSVPHVVVDASCIRWIITANDLDSISEPLRSRLVVFNIELPTPDQAKKIAQNIANKTVQEFGVSGFNSTLTEKILAECASMTPREVRIRIEIAIALAITEDIDCITPTIWKNSAIYEEPQQQLRRAIGFY